MGSDWHGVGLSGWRLRNCAPQIGTNTIEMNAANALIFAVLGSVMEMLPMAFPSWFPPSGSDQASARALWLSFMGAVQITVGFGFVVRFYVVPFGFRLLSLVPTESGSLALPNARSVSGR